MPSIRSSPRTASTPVKSSNKNEKSPVKKSPSKSPIKQKKSPTSKTSTKQKTPTKKGISKPSQTQSPAKKSISSSNLFTTLPSDIFDSLIKIGINDLQSLSSFKGSKKDLSQSIIANMPQKPTNKIVQTDENAKVFSKIKQEITVNWINLLYTISQSPTTTFKSWKQSISSAESPKSAKNTKEQGKLKMNRRQLITQRQALKHAKVPANKTIKFTDLKRAKRSLTSLPSGKSLRVIGGAEILRASKEKLRKLK